MPKFAKPKALAEVSSKTPWGASKKSFYAKGDQSDDNMSSSEAEEDQRQEAERLAQIRRQKMAR